MQEKSKNSSSLLVSKTENSFSRWSAGFSGLFWELERTRSRLKILNQWRHPLLGDNTARLLKDSQYRQQVVYRKDQHLFFEFWDVIASGTQAEIIFRVQPSGKQGNLFFLLQGWSHSGSPAILSGILQELPPVLLAENFMNEQSCGYLPQASYPVLEVDFNAKIVKISNQSASELFKATILGNEGITPLEDILPGNMQNGLWQKIFSMETNSWAGILTFSDLYGSIFNAQVRISPFANNFFRIAFMRIFPDQHYGTLEERRYTSILLEKVEHSSSLKESLEILLYNQLPDCVDGILFSDIKSSQGVVRVYGVGTPFAKMQWGATYAYEGTIALEIERYDLPFLIVEDTQDSIKSIDWVLFNPYGIRSYFAKPFYKRKRLHAVLILCSSSPQHFSFDKQAQMENQYTPIYKAFERAIHLWRNVLK